MQYNDARFMHEIECGFDNETVMPLVMWYTLDKSIAELRRADRRRLENGAKEDSIGGKAHLGMTISRLSLWHHEVAKLRQMLSFYKKSHCPV